jgi:hypothetical protein
MKIYSAVFSVSITAILYCECVESESTLFNDANVIPGRENKKKANVM